MITLPDSQMISMGQRIRGQHCRFGEEEQHNNVQNAMDAIALSEVEREVAERPKLDGEFELEFAKWIDGVKQPGTEIGVKIKGLPGDDITKRKHYWIYSMEAGWGKSTTVEMSFGGPCSSSQRSKQCCRHTHTHGSRRPGIGSKG